MEPRGDKKHAKKEAGTGCRFGATKGLILTRFGRTKGAFLDQKPHRTWMAAEEADVQKTYTPYVKSTHLAAQGTEFPTNVEQNTVWK